MEKKEIDLLVDQIRQVILGKEITSNMLSSEKDLLELQDGIKYLQNCLSEANEFIYALTVGNLEIEAPKNYNFFIGNLKELHSNLKHLTWQANQVANGDYNQNVSFLGDFSNSFNKMIFQLSERETELQKKSEILSESIELLKSIMDEVNDWIVVTSADKNEFIYINKAAKERFFDNIYGQHGCGEACALKQYLRNYSNNSNSDVNFEHHCMYANNFFSSKAHQIQWNGNLAYVHFIVNITEEKNYKEVMTRKAYRDELTGLYNRRFCVEKLNDYITKKKKFTISLIDVDGLKYANDFFGHKSGDFYLKTVADEISVCFRDNDYVARIGGDEFVVLSEEIWEEDMINRMKKIDQSLNDKSTDFPMSVSYGVIAGNIDENLKADIILETVDKKMYVQKKLKKSKGINNKI